MKYLFDIESTGLLRQNSQLHCIVLRDLDDYDADPLVFDTVKKNIEEGVELLQKAEILAGHNICNYDLALLQELYPDFKIADTLMDTLILSRIYYPNITNRDYERRPRRLPKKLYGSHSLKAWGFRLGEYKGDFAETNDWSTYSEEMLQYCIQDTTVNLRLYDLLNRRINETINA